MSSYFDYLCARQFISQKFIPEDDCLEMYLAPYSPHPVPWIVLDDANQFIMELYWYNEKLRDAELFSGSFEPFFNFNKDKYIVRLGEITWKYTDTTGSSTYSMSLGKAALDKKILSGEISKNELKK